MLLSSSPQSKWLIWPSVAGGNKCFSPVFLLLFCLIRSSSKGQARSWKRKQQKGPTSKELKIQYARLGKAHNQKDARKSWISCLYKFSPIQFKLAPTCLLQTLESASKTGFCVYALMCVVTIETFQHLEGLSLYVWNLNYRAASCDCIDNQSVVSASQS